MKRLFVVAGELSGDHLGAWYVNKLCNNSSHEYVIEAIGGDALQSSGAKIFERFEKLNVTGIVEIVRHIPRLLMLMDKIINYLIAQNIDEVVLIDFPGFNLRLAKRLKQKKPSLKITYLSPPQLWCWGKWRLTTLKKYTDQVIVMYPFEVEWYRQQGMQVVWLGNPVYDRLQKYFDVPVKAMPMVALLPGSRVKEWELLLPIIADVVKKMHVQFPEITFFLSKPTSLSSDFMQQQLERAGLIGLVEVIDGEERKMQALQHCCFAITKPGTVTLELALLKIPALVMYKTSRLTYFIGKRFAYVSHMALPNLLLRESVYPEFIQERCTSKKLFYAGQHLYQSFNENSVVYREQKKKLGRLQNLFSHKSA